MAKTPIEGKPPLGLDALHRLKTIEPPQWLAPSPELSRKAREASHYLFSSLKPFAPKSPFDHLLVDGFDAEQIWQQIDLQSQPLISSLRREIKRFEQNPEEISRIFGEKKVLEGNKKVLEKGVQDFDDVGDEDMEDFDEDDEEEGEEEDEDGEDEERESEEEEEEEVGGGGIEDRFLKIRDLEEYLEDDEAKEYGLKTTNKNKKQKNRKGGRGEIESSDEDDDELEELGLDDDGDEVDKLENSRYEDFFGGEKKKDVKRKSELIDGSEDSDTGDEQEDGEAFKSQKRGSLSTHEKELVKLHSTIEQMEQENLGQKTWTMQGEITAAKRPMNSALAADLDFEHNVRPAPVITEEVTASIEELIQKRILEGRFDDFQKPPSLPSKAPRERKELDENKSKKGLAEIYEEEYAQTTNLDSAPLKFSDERKKEASMLFKNLSLKLDALSHFHFTPKPVIDDMSIQANVPALAMEEIAPVAVSDAAMLAPEEVFTGKGDIKEDAELTQEERKRRRANKKRKFKAKTDKRMVEKKARESISSNGKEAVS